MKMTITYTTRVRKSNNIEVRVGYKKSNPKFVSKIILANSYLEEGNVRYEVKANVLWVSLFNLAMLFKSAKLGNKILDEMLVKAKKIHGNDNESK